MGFAAPVRHWFQHGHLRFFYDRLLSADMQHYFNMETIKRYLNEHEAHKEDHSGKLWYLLSFALWLEHNRAD
jgi:cyclopropane fatty-acyl-phospholipid synthase-like methyltransferase